jgi:hypothetical protein
MDDWEPPNFDDAWYERVSADPRSAIIADRFIREQLPHEQSGYGEDFASKLDRIVNGLTPAFLSVAMDLVATGYDRNIGAVAAGAIRDIESFEGVLAASLDELARLRRFYEHDGKEQWRAIEDGECDAAYEEGYQSSHDDDGFAAGIFVKVYVREVRSRGAWRSLIEHPRASELARPWAEGIAHSPGPISEEELRAVIASNRMSGDEAYAWEAVRQHWQVALEVELEERIMADCVSQPLRQALTECALTASPATLARCVARLASSPTSFVHLLVDVHAARLGSAKVRKQGYRLMLAAAPNEGGEIFRALPLGSKPPRAVGPEALSILELAAATVDPAVLDKIVPVMIVSGSVPTAAIGRWLTQSKDQHLALAATEAAIEIKNNDLVWLALGHERADAREAALKYLAPLLPDPLPPQLLRLSSDPGSRVRQTLVGILHNRPHPHHQSVLVSLLQDQWSDAEPYHNEPQSHPIAREAVAALGAYETLGPEIGEALLLVAQRTEDRALSSGALPVAAKRCGAEFRKRIWALALVNRPRRVRVDAIDALIVADRVEDEIVDSITPKLLLTLPAPLAASASVLLAAHGRVESAVQAMERIAHSANRRALLLLGVVVLAERDRASAAGLLRLLDTNHPAQRLLDLADGELLPRTVLDDLGHIRIRRAVQTWLKDAIERN